MLVITARAIRDTGMDMIMAARATSAMEAITVAIIIMDTTIPTWPMDVAERQADFTAAMLHSPAQDTVGADLAATGPPRPWVDMVADSVEAVMAAAEGVEVTVDRES
jgi:hypothetical protein